MMRLFSSCWTATATASAHSTSSRLSVEARRRAGIDRRLRPDVRHESRMPAMTRPSAEPATHAGGAHMPSPVHGHQDDCHELGGKPAAERETRVIHRGADEVVPALRKELDQAAPVLRRGRPRENLPRQGPGRPASAPAAASGERAPRIRPPIAEPRAARRSTAARPPTVGHGAGKCSNRNSACSANFGPNGNQPGEDADDGRN